MLELPGNHKHHDVEKISNCNSIDKTKETTTICKEKVKFIRIYYLYLINIIFNTNPNN